MSSSQRKFTLVSSPLCPDVQRAAIALNENGAPFELITIDLDNKPVWFDVISPLGKTPVLIIDDNVNGREVIFESAVILDYLEETLPRRLHPTDPLQESVTGRGSNSAQASSPTSGRWRPHPTAPCSTPGCKRYASNSSGWKTS